jgi:hypothetical protein
MKKTNRSNQAEARLHMLMIALLKDFNTTEFRPFDSKLYRDTYGVGAGYYSALKELEAIETTYGKIKLTERFYTLRPSTLRKYMNKGVYRSVAAKTAKPVQVTPVYDIDVLRAQIRQEVLQELRDSLQAQSEILAKLK